jgi:hypothetical protein
MDMGSLSWDTHIHRGACLFLSHQQKGRQEPGLDGGAISVPSVLVDASQIASLRPGNNPVGPPEKWGATFYVDIQNPYIH